VDSSEPLDSFLGRQEMPPIHAAGAFGRFAPQLHLGCGAVDLDRTVIANGSTRSRARFQLPPFSFQVLPRASSPMSTTTKICAMGCSIKVHTKTSQAPTRPSTCERVTALTVGYKWHD